ncbi:MAG: endolytic transglycosylase MltG [Bacteroidetes bacterium]|nr:MAG: endolytic transglycosylase MltG [Bacteroidota bacterium]
MSKSIVKKLIIGAVILVGLILAWPKISLYLAGNRKTLNTVETSFFFEEASGLDGLVRKLQEKKIIDSPDDLYQVAEYKSLNSEKLAGGKYRIAPGTKYRHLLNGFTKNAAGNGNAEQEVNVVFNNCRDIYDMASKVAQCVQMDSASLVNFIMQDETLAKYDLSDDLIGVLFVPNTYRMYWDVSPEQFVERMHKNYQAFWTPERKQKMKQKGFREAWEVVTLASIVYAEQGRHSEEWKTIASLYLNRLRIGMKLRSDPTFRFCWGDALNGVQRLTYKHRDKDCPYNTYLYEGLPPGPINMPPIKAIEAVLDAPKTNYFYMVAQPNYSGKHYFSNDYAGHLSKARVYSAWLKKEGIR